MSYGITPEQAALTVHERLDRSLALPGVEGILRGVVTGPPRVTAVESGPMQGALVRDYPFHVTGGFGRALATYFPTATISLRIPGGTLGSKTDVVSNAPRVTPGKEYFVWVHDQGVVAGGNSDGRVVASTPYSLFEVANGMVIGKDVSEPVAVFEQHFVKQAPSTK